MCALVEGEQAGGIAGAGGGGPGVPVLWLGLIFPALGRISAVEPPAGEAVAVTIGPFAEDLPPAAGKFLRGWLLDDVVDLGQPGAGLLVVLRRAGGAVEQ